MKSAGTALHTNDQRSRLKDKERKSLRECVALHDPSDCLLEAYDCVARRAYEYFLERGAKPGRELDDWVKAERELLPSLPAHVNESGDFVYALASIPGATAEELSVGLESRWLVILASSKTMKRSPARSFCVLELPAEIDPTRTVAVLADGMLAIRMAKVATH